MHITITDIVGKKRIDLTYLIRGRDVTIVSAFVDSVQYEFTKPWKIELELGNKQIMAGTYMRRELPYRRNDLKKMTL